MITPPTLKHFAETTLPRHLRVLLEPLDAAVLGTETVDLEASAMDYSLAVFGEIAFDVSGWFPSFSKSRTKLRMISFRLIGRGCRLPFQNPSANPRDESRIVLGSRSTGSLSDSYLMGDDFGMILIAFIDSVGSYCVSHSRR